MRPEVTDVERDAPLRWGSPAPAGRRCSPIGGAPSRSAPRLVDRIPDRWLEKPCDLEDLRSGTRRDVDAAPAG